MMCHHFGLERPELLYIPTILRHIANLRPSHTAGNAVEGLFGADFRTFFAAFLLVANHLPFDFVGRLSTT